MDSVEYVHLVVWIGLKVYLLDPLDVLLALGKVFYSDPKEYF